VPATWWQAELLQSLLPPAPAAINVNLLPRFGVLCILALDGSERRRSTLTVFLISVLISFSSWYSCRRTGRTWTWWVGLNDWAKQTTWLKIDNDGGQASSPCRDISASRSYRITAAARRLVIFSASTALWRLAAKSVAAGAAGEISFCSGAADDGRSIRGWRNDAGSKFAAARSRVG